MTSAQPLRTNIERDAFFKLSYGLYLLCTHTDGKDNGCIINTVLQVTDTPPQHILFTVHAQTLTAKSIHVGNAITVSVLDETAPFSLYRRFGMQSGRTMDKFASMDTPRAQNGVRYLQEYACAMISATVQSAIPCGTHTIFLAAVTEARTLSEHPPATYAYYQTHVKPPTATATKKTTNRYVCTVCGYVYEGEQLPPDFVCPWCHHGAEVFEKQP